MDRRTFSRSAGPLFVALCTIPVAGCSDSEVKPPEMTVEGTINTIIADDFTNHASWPLYTLRTDDGTAYHVTFGDTDKPPVVPSGSRVRVVGSLLAPDQIETTVGGFVVIQDAMQRRPRTAEVKLGGTHRVAVLLVKYSGDSENMTTDQAKQILFGGSSSVLTGFFSEDSFNSIQMTGDVFGYYELDGTKDACKKADLNHLSDNANTKAKKDVDVSGYDHVLYILPYTGGDCGYGGLGEEPGTRSWFPYDQLEWAAGHEVGHNLGLGHAGAWNCTDKDGNPTVISGNCSVDEYGDPFDMMGGIAHHHHGNFHKARIGMFGSNIQTVGTDGDYTILPIESPQSGTQVLRIPMAWKGGWYYYLEFRQSFGAFDNFGGDDPVVKGVLMRIAPETTVQESSDNRQLILDATPWTKTFDDAALGVGSVFVDDNASNDAGKFSIEVLSAGMGSAQVRIRFKATPAPGSESCADLASARGWPSHYCDTSQSGMVCGTEGFQTSDCAFCCPDPYNHGGGGGGGHGCSAATGAASPSGGGLGLLLLVGGLVLARRRARPR